VSELLLAAEAKLLQSQTQQGEATRSAASSSELNLYLFLLH
jgi:hypothetical protein